VRLSFTRSPGAIVNDFGRIYDGSWSGRQGMPGLVSLALRHVLSWIIDRLNIAARAAAARPRAAEAAAAAASRRGTAELTA